MHHDEIAVKTEETMNRTYTIMPPSATELQKVVKSLEKIVAQQKQKRENAQRALDQFKLRAIKRQQQMNNLIYSLKRSNSSLRDQNPEISKLFNTIWSNFDIFNQKSIEMLEEKCEDTIGLMDRKIKSIVSVYQDELEHNRKKSNVNVQTIMGDIRKVYIVAAKIQQKNIQLSEENKRLSFEINVLKEQKILAIEDAVNRKRKITGLRQENKKLVDQLLKARLDSHSQKRNSSQRGSHQSIIVKQIPNYFNQKKFHSTKLGDEEKTMVKHKSELYSFQSLMDNHNMRIETLQYFKDKNHNNHALMNSTISYTPPNKHQINLDQTVKNPSFSFNRNGRVTKRCSPSTSQSYRQKSTKPNDTEPQICTCPLVRQNKQKQYYYMNTIQNIQKSLKREKQKCHMLGTIVTQISNKSKEINQVLEQVLKEEEQGEHRLQVLTKSQKLFQILKILKQRLSMIQKPSLNCGWGDSLADL